MIIEHMRSAYDCEAHCVSRVVGRSIGLRYLRYGTPPRLIVATATRACSGGEDPAYGNHLNALALANKLDFARLHGYELWVHAEKVQHQGILRAIWG